ncbi:glyoxalase/bleomycin resistance/extradiol dioxygenase family protein [Zobellella endophytica]|uniref:Glyoxalase/bleomycin resistance/extradiol dioxygenase family protein n=1 Tax=Zobellella endophytica TaxID=2116700 RepID=A0A2P7RBZ0_9GAMM|nr:VOC family protein [Zobellella endophytica]PSJ47672.1 glyoxalase/bleomycin resistance/extradiol dioxygenase family protein [Zobellella endophytica]
MPQAIYVNLPVADLSRTMRFFEALGFAFNPRFTNEQAAALVISDTIFAMLHTPDSFRRFTRKPIADAASTTEVLLALQLESRARVDELMAKVLAAGGREAREPEEYDFMYGRAFEDPDGHIWELFWMDAAEEAESP